MKSIFVAIFFLTSIGALHLFGQQVTHNSFCGHENVIHYNEKLYPGYSDFVKRTFDEAHQLITKSSNSRNKIFTIPVVVHVVWKTDSENLHDSIIESQLNVLNESFRLQNTDRDSLRSIFKEIQADAGIEFRLEEVIRVKTSSNFSLSLTGLPDKVKQSAQGGSDAKDPDRNLNIWVCRIQPIPIIGGQILGYAYPPVGLANWPTGSSAPSKSLEGVVIDFRVFGKNNPNIMTVNNQKYNTTGKTTVHEIGHYLGLRHIWGDGGGLFGGNSCNEDDGITDTPNQGAQTGGGCDKTANTCIDSNGNDLPDMIENYMDYSAESCQNTFTREQIDLMRSVLQNQRSQLVNTEEQLALSRHFKIYPNPASTFFSIESTQGNIMDKITITNQFGILLASFKSLSNQEMEIKHLASGLYFVNIYTLGKVVTHKILKVDE